MNKKKVIDDFRIKGKLLCKAGQYYVLYRKGGIYIYTDIEKHWCKKVRIHNTLTDRVLTSIRIVERTFRLEPRLAINVADDEIVFSQKGNIYNLNLLNLRITVEHRFREGMNNPLSFCSRVDKDGITHVLYGEYWPNRNRDEVSVFERIDGIWERRYTFPSKSIKHIHQIIYDPNEESYLIATGDSDGESAIWKADLQFQKVEPLHFGNQMYRTCFIIPRNGYFLYPTDSPVEKNRLISTASGEPVPVYEMPGPCIYGRTVNEKYHIMATSVECRPDETWIGGLLHNKLAAGVKDFYSHLILYNAETERFIEIGKFKKDIISVVFLFGNIMFPNVSDDSYIYFTGQALNGIDGCTARIRISELG